MQVRMMRMMMMMVMMMMMKDDDKAIQNESIFDEIRIFLVRVRARGAKGDMYLTPPPPPSGSIHTGRRFIVGYLDSCLSCGHAREDVFMIPKS